MTGRRSGNSMLRRSCHDRSGGIRNGWDLCHLRFTHTLLGLVHRLFLERHPAAIFPLAHLVVEHFFCCKHGTLAFHELRVEETACIAERTQPVRTPAPFGRLGGAAPMAFVHRFIDHLSH